MGTFGAFAMFSLYPTKNMTSGEGGMVSTGDEDLARRVRLLRNQGMERQYENEVVGFNARMTDLHAAIGNGMEIRPIRNMVNHETNELFFDNLELPADSLIGEEGKGEGVKLEQQILVTETGTELLSRFPFEESLL